MHDRDNTLPVILRPVLGQDNLNRLRTCTIDAIRAWQRADRDPRVADADVHRLRQVAIMEHKRLVANLAEKTAA